MSDSDSTATGSDTNNGRSTPTARAVAWAGRIMGVSAVMILPGLFGQWLDKRLGTSFLTLIGFGIGMTAGIAGLLFMTRQQENVNKKKRMQD